MYQELEDINKKPELYGEYSAMSLWADEHRSKQMLAYHLNEDIDVSSRKKAFIDKSAQWIISNFLSKESSSVCDFGCGPGLYTSRFAMVNNSRETNNKVHVTGIDFSNNSINYAKNYASEHGLDINYIQSNYLEVELQQQYDLITMIMCDYCALNDDQRKTLLNKFKQHLKDDGKILLDVYTTNAFQNKAEGFHCEKNQLNHFWFEEGYYTFVNTHKYPEQKVILDKYTTFTQSGKKEVVYNWLKYYDLDTLTKELKGVGLKINAVYSDVSGNDFDENADEFAVVIEKGS